jgi:hypothetical protein
LDEERELRAEAEEEAEEAEELEEEREAAREARQEERIERTLRQTLVTDLEKAVTKDAQEAAAEEFAIIEGPILETQCEPKGGAIDTEARTQSFSCLAITEFTGGGGAEGYRYSAEINYESFSYRWRLGGGGV